VADNHSIEQRIWRSVGRSVRGMGPSEELASVGALIVIASMLLPWYGAPIASNLAQTGAGSFSFASAALLLTVGAALYLALEVGSGYRPPRPLTVGGLLVADGVWAALIVVFQMYARPDFNFGGVDQSYNLRYGVAVAFVGSALIVLAGVQRRRHEHAGRMAHADDHLDEVDLGEDED